MWRNSLYIGYSTCVLSGNGRNNRHPVYTECRHGFEVGLYAGATAAVRACNSKTGRIMILHIHSFLGNTGIWLGYFEIS